MSYGSGDDSLPLGRTTRPGSARPTPTQSDTVKTSTTPKPTNRAPKRATTQPTPPAPSLDENPELGKPRDDVVKPALPRDKRNDKQKVKRPKPTKKPRAPRVVPPAGVVPTMGWQKQVYLLHKLFGRPEKGLKFSRQELDVLHTEALRKDALYDVLRDSELADAEMRFLARNVQATVVMVNPKGGSSKTTTALYFGSEFTETTRKTAFELPATGNGNTATIALNAGIAPGESLTVSQFSGKFKELRSYRAISGLVPRTKHGVAVISEDADESVNIGTQFRKTNFADVFDALYGNADLIVLDTGNDDINDESVVLEAVRRGDVVVLPATANNQVTLELLSKAIAMYITDTQLPSSSGTSGEALSRGEQIATRDKIKNAIVVISKAPHDATPQDYAMYVQRRDSHGNVIGDLGFKGELMLIPEDQYIGNNVVCDLYEIELTTRLAYKRLVNAALKKAAELKGIDLSQLTDVRAYDVETLARKRGITLADPNK